MNQHKTIYLAGGCFWGMEEYMSRLDGVCETEVGYGNSLVERQPEFIHSLGGRPMGQKKETNEVRYSVARKLLNLMLENGFISEEEYKKIDALNRETFSPELSKVYG